MKQHRWSISYSGQVAVVMSVGMLVVSLGRNVLPPVLPLLIEQLSITASEAGVAITLMWGLFAFVQYPGGHFADAWTRKTIIVAGVGMLLVGFLLLLIITSYVEFVLGVALVGSGSGFFVIGTRTLLSDHFVDRRGEIFGVNIAAAMAGGAIAASVAGVAIAAFTWQAAFVPILVILFLILVWIHKQSEEPYSISYVGMNISTTGARMKSPHVWRAIVVYILVMFTWRGVLTFLPIFLHIDKGFSPEISSVGFSLVFGVGIFAQPLAGRISDQMARTLIASIAIILATLGLGLLIIGSSLPVIGIAILLFAAGVMSFPPVMQAHLMDLFPEGSRGSDLGAARTIYLLVASLAPTYVGVVGERMTYTIAFVGFIPCLFLGTVVLVWLTWSA